MNYKLIKKSMISIFILFYILSLMSVQVFGISDSSDNNAAPRIMNDDASGAEEIDQTIYNDDNEAKSLERSLKESSELVKHTPITVIGNDDFFTKAESEGWAGNGTEKNPFIIENYDINANGAGNAIMISNTDLHFMIRNCTVYNAIWLSNPFLAGEGIAVYNASNGVIVNNTAFSNDGDGIDLQITTNMIVRDNEALSNYDDGIHITESNGVLVEDNTVSTNQDDGIYVEGNSRKNIIRNNVINLNTKYSINTFHTRNNEIINNEIIRSKAGIISSHCDGMLIKDNRIQSSDYGIFLLENNRSEVDSNEISGGEYGLYTSSAGNNIFTNNTIISSEFTGASFTLSSDRNYINNNTISANGRYGIYISSSINNKLNNNTIFSNEWVGITIFKSNSNTFRYNNISRNSIGIDISESRKNLIYNNNFINNDNQAKATKKNFWDNGYPVGGNYWSDYNGSDKKSGIDQDEEGSDGIGDSLYFVFRENNIDNYPLMTPIKSSSEVRPPSSPRNFEIEEGDKFMILNWDTPEDTGGSPLTGYKIYKGTSTGNISLYKNLRELKTSYFDDEVENNVTYFYYVTALNSVGQSNKTDTLSGAPKEETSPPGIPQDFTAEFDNKDSNILRWDPPSENIDVTKYFIYRGKRSDEKVIIDNVSGITYTYEDKNIERNVTYYYQISGKNSAGEGSRSEEKSVIIGPKFLKPSAPTDISMVEGDNQITIEWDPPEDTGGKMILGYNVYRSTSNGRGKLIATLTDNEIYIDKNLTNYNTYYYRVSAFNEIGEGELSKEVDGEPSFQGEVGGPKGNFYESNWFMIPLLVIIIILVVAKIFVIDPLIQGQR